MPRFLAPLPGSKHTSATSPAQEIPPPTNPPQLNPPPLHPSLRRRTPPPPIQGTGALNRGVPPPTLPIQASPVPASSNLTSLGSASQNLTVPTHAIPTHATPNSGTSSPNLDSPTPAGTPTIETPRILIEDVHPTSPGSPGSLASLMPTFSEVDDEEELTEQELREMYDEEEMQRFLHMFSTYVHEVRMPGQSPQPHSLHETGITPSSTHLELGEPEVGHDEDDWVPVQPPQEGMPSTPQPVHYGSLSERIAVKYVMPHLPPPPPSSSQVTLGRLKMSAERLYLAVEPTYLPFLVKVHQLATWDDWHASRKWCIIFWVLWSQNILLPAFIARILYSLLRRRLLPYPSLEELRARRADADRAAKFGERVHARLLLRPGSEVGVQDAWRALKFMNQSRRNLLGKGKDKESKNPEKMDTLTAAAAEASNEAPPKSDEEWLDLEEDDLVKLGVELLTGLADLHERVKNIFLWRRPRSSNVYGLALAFLLLATLFIPAKYLAKGVYFCLGFAFWHVTPVIVALPSSARARLPPPLSDVPTDLDYAIQLMSERVARGLPVRPLPRHRKRAAVAKFGKSAVSLLSPNASSLSLDASYNNEGSENNHEQDDENERRDWVRDAVKAVDTSKSWVKDGVNLVKDIRGVPSGKLPSKAGLFSQPTVNEESHPFLAQHTKLGPGLLTLTQTSILFAPFVSRSTPTSSPRLPAVGSSNAASAAKLVVALSDVRGVKKTGALSVRGIAIRWADGKGQEREERFLWVRGREEAFARLVSADRRWLRV